MAQIEVKLPSGARGRVRGLRGEEINLFANRQASRRGKTAMQILKNVWVETLDTGTLYNGSIEWEKAPACDRFVALFFARVATYGADYTFKYQCEDPGCRKRFEWNIDLEHDLTIKDLPDTSIERFKSGNKFETVITDNDGRDLRVVFQLLTPKLEASVDQVANLAPREKATASLAQRIVEMDTIGADKGAIKRYLNNLDAGAVLELVSAMDDVDGGIETGIEIECPHCGYIMEIELPLRDEFWSPARKKPSTNS